ncbi:MATE family efflux transporter [bacterium]|nr:MATE family efflux transporter [bacterium]
MATKELTEGHPLKLILWFMLPIFIGNVFQQLYNFVDALIVSRTLGIEALAAVGATMPLIFFFISFIFASTQGFTIVTAQKFGAKDYDGVRKSFCTSIVLAFILMVILTSIATPLTHHLLKFLSTPENIIDYASQYLFIMFVGFFAVVFYNLSSNVMRALGDSKTPLYFLIFTSFLNIILDLTLIIKLNMGITGAALATVISQGVSTLLCITYIFWKFEILRFKKSDWKPDFEFYKEHLKIGIPMGIQMSVLSLGMVAIQYVLNTLGSNAIAAYTTVMVIDQVFTQVFLALGATMAVYTAQNYGANKISRIKTGTKYALCIIGTVSVFSIIVLSLYSENFIMLFMREHNAEVLKMATQYIHIVMWFFVFLGLLMSFRNILQGMGRVMAPLISGIAELIARCTFAFILGHHFGFTGVCTATPAAWVSASIILLLSYKISLIKIHRNISTRTN